MGGCWALVGGALSSAADTTPPFLSVRFINQAPLDGKPRQLIRSAGDLPIELDACESVDVEDEEDDE